MKLEDLIDTNIDVGIPNSLSELLSTNFKKNKDPLDAQLDRVESLENKAYEAGIPEELQQPRESVFSKALNFIDKAKQPVVGLLDAAFVRKDLLDVGVPGVISRSWQERADSFKVLRRAGVENPVVRGVLGLAGEIVLDPLNLISFGAGAAGKWGGRALNETGQALAKEATDASVKKLLSEGVEKTTALAINKAQRNVAEAFSHLGRYDDLIRKIDIAKVKAKPNLTLIKDLSDQADTAFSAFKSLAPELATKDLTNVFAKNKLNIGISLPFIGHITGRESTLIANEAPAIQKAITRLGNFLKPAELKLGSIDIPRTPVKVASAIEDLKALTAKNIVKINKIVTDTPVLGKVVGKVEDLTTSVVKGVKDTFMTTLGYSPYVKGARTEALSAKEASKLVAAAKANDYFGELISNPNLASEVGLIHDSTNANAMSDIIRTTGGNPEDFVRAVVNAAVDLKTGTVKSEDIGDLSASILKAFLKDNPTNAQIAGQAGNDFLQQMFAASTKQHIDALRKGVNKATGLPLHSPEAFKWLDVTTKAFDDIIETRRAAGIDTDYYTHYISHIIQNIASKPEALDAFRGFIKSTSYGAKRTHNTLEDLLNATGLIGKTNVVEIYLKAAMDSYQAIAEKDLLGKLVREGGMLFDDYMNMYKLALINPDAAATLKARDLPFMDLTDPANLTEARLKSFEDLYKIADFSARRDESYKQAGKLVGKIIKEQPDSAVVKTIQYSAIQDIFNNFELSAKAKGFIPKDAKIPVNAFGDVARFVDYKGERFAIPEKLAKIYDDARGNRDILESALSGTPIGKTLLKMFDAATNWIKKFTLWPYPAYWSQGVFGNTFLTMAEQGAEIMNLGRFVKTHNLLKGAASLATPNGVLDAQTFQQIIKQAGVKFSADEALGIFDNFGNIDYTAMEKLKRSVKDNAKRLEIGTLAKKGIDFLQDNFENFFRINHLVYELEKGSSIPDAIQAMNDAMLNYRSLSKIESSFLRRFYMFYPWIKASSAKTLHMFLFKPNAISNQIRVARAFSETLSDPNALPSIDEVDKKNISDIISREQIAFSLGKDKQGKEITGTGFGLPINTMLQQFTLAMPRSLDFKEVLSTVDYNFTRNLQKQAASSNPIFKTIAERLTGKDLYFNQPLSRDFLHTLPSFEKAAEKLAPYPYTGIPQEILKGLDKATIKFLDGVPDGKGGLVVNPVKYYYLVSIMPPISRAVSTAKRFADQDLPIPHALLHFLTGIKVRPTNAELTRAYERGDALQEILNEYNADARIRYQGGGR